MSDSGCRKCAPLPGVHFEGRAHFPFDFGHDGLGHRVANVLNQNRYADYDAVRAASDQELLSLRNLGVNGLARVRQVLDLAPAGRGPDGASP